MGREYSKNRIVKTMKGKYLITTDNWFYAPDGKQYRAVYGEVKVLKDDFLGIKTNVRSTNWFIQVGNEKENVIIAGCQIHYASKTDVVPIKKMVKDYSTDKGELKEFERPTSIYVINE